jgi:hypothetical protein
VPFPIHYAPTGGYSGQLLCDGEVVLLAA